MATCPIDTSIQTIPREECIGNSLSRINDNFLNLKTQTCKNYGDLEDIDSNILNLQTLYSNLSSITVPGTAKAWLKFDGTRDSNGVVTAFLTNRFIYSSYNISTVYKKATGDYRVYFSTPFASPDYTVIGTSSEVLSPDSKYTLFQPYRYTSSYVDVRVHSDVITDTVDAEHISITIF